jgi:two-component system sensor histidine kinase/response regulator
VPTAVLINVDDNEPARYARTRILLQAGFTVHDAATGGQALQKIGEVRPDLVLLDVHLPDMDGIEVCRWIKNREETAAVIVLQISASAVSAPQATAALNTGADSYLVEPVDPDVLVATIRALLRLRTAERAVAQANRELSEKNVELQLLNKALQRSNQDLEHFAYLGNHDLQEPLRNITTHIELLERTAASRFTESERQLFEVVIDGARRMTTLIQDVLAYSGIATETPTLSPTNLDEALQLAVKNLSEVIAKSSACVTAGELPMIYGDYQQLSRVFQNLIANSIKYCSPGLPIRLNIAAKQDSTGVWLISVRDNGIGIPQEHLEKIFEPFKRLHGREIPGTGIGLALCHRIIDAHGGRIWAESREGDGATFLFTLRPAGS